MRFIVNHRNYTGMPHPYKADGSVRWVVTGNSSIGLQRRRWWDRKREEKGIPKDRGWLAETAEAIHPTGRKVCQICGREMSIHYVYPRGRYLEKLNEIEAADFTIFHEIGYIVEKIVDRLGDKGYYSIKRIFKVPDAVPRGKEDYIRYITEKCRTKLSPGSMSDAPDRFDGYHTYNRCCRKEQDTGRHDENLGRYIEDRRAYEHWADGDWKAASWLMRGERGVCPRCGRTAILTADHIGPISLGFRHRPKFQPLCRACNSAKNNRMMLVDIKQLISDEQSGEEVISWHSKDIWDLLKDRPRDDLDAARMSKLMRTYHHHVMETLYIISANGYKDFPLNFLHPEYAYYSVEFENLDRRTFQYERMVKKRGTKKQYGNNAARYVRIAFESLNAYHSKTLDNRRVRQIMNDVEIKERISVLLDSLENDLEFNNLRTRKLLEESFGQRSLEKRESLIKMALDELEERPTRNHKAEAVLAETLSIIARKIASGF
ncbi:MAG: HNH endonuclease [Candidatus Bathyarchaeota archaeon]|nr:HNH endonuclease [Candidatus Bathyarchaeota archaeon]MDH5689518.1 HNH endonuclease [Candidatus Bathyarchaeota archaeon]